MLDQLTELASAARCYLACENELFHSVREKAHRRLCDAITAADEELAWEQPWTLAEDTDTDERLDPNLVTAEAPCPNP